MGDCVQFSDWNGLQTGTITKPEYAGGYQVNWNGTLIVVGANSRDIVLCPVASKANNAPIEPKPPQAAPPVARPVPPSATHTAAPAPVQTTATVHDFKVGDCVQFAYANGWETGTIAQPEYAGGYAVNWGSIVATAVASPKYLRACPSGAENTQDDVETRAAMSKLPRATESELSTACEIPQPAPIARRP